MIKCVCDHCGKETELVVGKSLPDGFNVVSRACLEGRPYHLCDECVVRWDALEDELNTKNAKEYIKFLTSGLKETEEMKANFDIPTTIALLRDIQCREDLTDAERQALDNAMGFLARLGE